MWVHKLRNSADSNDWRNVRGQMSDWCSTQSWVFAAPPSLCPPPQEHLLAFSRAFTHFLTFHVKSSGQNFNLELRIFFQTEVFMLNKKRFYMHWKCLFVNADISTFTGFSWFLVCFQQPLLVVQKTLQQLQLSSLVESRRFSTIISKPFSGSIRLQT